MKDYLGGRHVVNVSFFNDEGFLGSLNLNRKKEEGDFSDREVQILELIEPQPHEPTIKMACARRPQLV